MQPDLTNGLLWYIAFLYSTTCHESAHALAALKLGDDTAARGGQVSLNPWPHLRRAPVGMVVVPVICWIAGGWIIGWASTPFDPEWARRFPRRMALMALAGPAANLALLVIAAALLRLGLEWHQFTVPYGVAPSRIVDVSSLPLLLLPAAAADQYFSLVRSPVVRTIGLLVIFRSSGLWFGPLLRHAASLLFLGLNPT